MNEQVDMSTGSPFTEFPAEGVSMGRSWCRARSLLVETVLAEHVAWADVIVYRGGTGWVAHRVVRCLSGEDSLAWVTKGDGTWTPDRLPVSADQLVGVVRGVRWTDRYDEVRPEWFGRAHALVGWIGSFVWPPLRGQMEARK
jgi:hypothetical protein